MLGNINLPQYHCMYIESVNKQKYDTISDDLAQVDILHTVSCF